MKKLVDWMNKNIAPRVMKISQNVWLNAVQEAFQIIMPFILVGSIVSLLKTLHGAFDWIPYTQLISDYTFGLMGIMVAFLIPYYVCQKKKYVSQSVVAGFTALSSYLLLSTVGTEGSISIGQLGATGLFVSVIVGLLTAVLFHVFLKNPVIKEDSSLPMFIQNWFNTIVPLSIVILLSYVIGFVMNVDLFAFLMNLLSPLLTVGQSYVGLLLVYFAMVFLYSFGISPWAIAAVIVPIWNMGIQMNMDAVAAGQMPTAINTAEVIFNGWLNVGGLGCTLPLIIMSAFSKSKRLKTVGRTVLVPSLFNINEPAVFGLSIAWNPLLMIPMWIIAIVAPTLTYLALSLNLVNIPSQVYQMSFLPTGLNSIFVSSDFRGIILWLAITAVITVIWLPFFKAYEKLEIEKEKAEI